MDQLFRNYPDFKLCFKKYFDSKLQQLKSKPPHEKHPHEKHPHE